MVVPDYHEEDGHSTASSSTQLPSQHPLRQHIWERLGGGTDLSTVLPTPLNHHHHLLSPIRTETPSHGYTLHATPERIEREGSQGNGFGQAVAGGDGGVAGAVAGSGGDVTGSGGGRVGGRSVVGSAGGDARCGAAGTAAARLVGGTVGRSVGSRIGRGGIGRAEAGGGGRVPGGGRT